jgi:hypothetical protein
MPNTPTSFFSTHERKVESTRSAWDVANEDTNPYLLPHQEQVYLQSLVKLATKRRSLFARSLANILRHFHSPEPKREAAILFLRALGNSFSEGCYGRDELGGPDLDCLDRLNYAKHERYRTALVQIIGVDAVLAIDHEVEHEMKEVERQLDERLSLTTAAEGSGASRFPQT